jgi:hypothetical protein
MATTLGVDASAVNVTGVADVALAGRRLQQTGGSSGVDGGAIAVTFRPSVSGGGNATALLASVTALSTSSEGLMAALRSVGISATVTVAAPVLTAAPVVVPVLETAAAATSYYASVEADLSTLSSSEALSVVTQVATALNDPNSALNANASAAAGVRASLLTAIAASATSANTSAGVESAALTVSSLVANASQISAAGATAALDILLAVSSAGSGSGNVVFTQDASNAVTGALSSIVNATSADAVDTAVLGSVFSVVNNLAGSQLVGLAAGASVEVSSPAI